jgi:trimeric autotransporter adhesin
MVTSSGAATTTATFATTAPTSGALSYPQTNQRLDHRWYTAAGGAALAWMLFCGIPARRRGWRSTLGLLVFLVAAASVGCGGGGGGNHNNPVTPGTTTGTYTFTVTGTGSVTSAMAANTTVMLTVN